MNPAGLPLGNDFSTSAESPSGGPTSEYFFACKKHKPPFTKKSIPCLEAEAPDLESSVA